MRLIALLVLLFCSCSQSTEHLYERSFHSMGSTVELKFYSPSEELFHRVVDACVERTKEIDRLFSNYRDDSVLAEVNRNAGARPVPVPGEFLRLVRISVNYSEITGGAFDITIGSLFELWRAETAAGRLPEKSRIHSALRCTGFRKIKIDEAKSQVFFDTDCLRLDFGAIGKGYAVDEMVRIARQNGITRGLVNFGGNIYAMNPPAGKKFWYVGVRKPGSGSEIISNIDLVNKGVATSGDYARYCEHGGKRYSHIIDPRTGWPAGDVTSVVAVSRTATEADVFSTAVSVLGLPGAQTFVQRDKSLGFLVVGGKGEEKSCFGSYVCP
ncbi:MAG: FAD:protein FMN transferase [Candidatus Dadabacteria bacterium]|nr:FAD:protein FMN transferase [Candidatus Dadabacteria bacterium]